MLVHQRYSTLQQLKGGNPSKQITQKLKKTHPAAPLTSRSALPTLALPTRRSARAAPTQD